ncbi:hypothetical protein IFM89_024099 [Coptis chinensis]|uniref:Uncharacterized protein n=1 Tax=Coptis chinensis TaxID=261450 RepID=A0A835IDE1_9MAGN|nr:hypothetical protein IFM89_024099 [Coptis chinensis]
MVVLLISSRLWAFSGGRGVIERMPMEPNSGAWGALLGGCGDPWEHRAILVNSSYADNVGSDDIVSFEGIESREKISESVTSCEPDLHHAHVDTFVKEEI